MFDHCRTSEDCTKLYHLLAIHLCSNAYLMQLLEEDYNIAVGYLESEPFKKKNPIDPQVQNM